MTRTKLNQTADCRLSYSSGKMIKGCSQKYWHYKVNETPKDSDFVENREALAVGSAFHWVLEMNNHTEDRVAELVRQAVAQEDIVEKQALVHAMVLKYLKLHAMTGLTCVHVELEITDEDFIGFIDAIMVDTKGKWWIVDLKTAKMFNDLTANKLHNDTQLNLYAYYVNDIADALELEVKNFAGVRYRATTKPSLKQRSGEAYLSYVKRLYGSMNSYDAVIRVGDLRPKEFMEDHKKLHQLSLDLRRGKAKPEKNYEFCSNYFQPCAYWSQCHGSNYTGGRPAVQLIAL